MIDFSLIMPVKGNLSGLKTCLGAFDLFTAQPERFEVHLIADRDDNEMIDFASKASYKFKTILHLADKTDNFSNDYFNHHVQFCAGTHIWAFNDDCYVQTNKWDDIVRTAVKDKFNGVYLVDLYDSTRESAKTPPFPRFPIISRKAVDAIGFFFFPQVRQYPADKCIWDLYSQTGCVVSCQEVKLQHDHNFDHENDPQKSRFMRILREDMAMGVFPVDGNKEYHKLKKAIDNG